MITLNKSLPWEWKQTDLQKSGVSTKRSHRSPNRVITMLQDQEFFLTYANIGSPSFSGFVPFRCTPKFHSLAKCANLRQQMFPVKNARC